MDALLLEGCRGSIETDRLEGTSAHARALVAGAEAARSEPYWSLLRKAYSLGKGGMREDFSSFGRLPAHSEPNYPTRPSSSTPACSFSCPMPRPAG